MTPRFARRLLLAVILPCAAAATCAADAQGSLLTLRMNEPRAAHTATALADGRIPVVGGFHETGTGEVPIASAEIYDPGTGTFTPTGSLNEARDGHAAMLLPDGDVLIVGGWGAHERLASAELYDHRAGHFVRVGSLAAPRQGMTVTRLRDGRVLIAGGDTARGVPALMAEIYDPATGQFLRGGSLKTGRAAHTATLLDDGRVLLAGGVTPGGAVLSSADVYDPVTETFTPTGAMGVVRDKHAAVLLASGEVLVIGGSNQEDWRGTYATAEVYEPSTGVFHPVSPMNRRRFKLSDASIRLDNGLVFVAGGDRLIELFDPEPRRFVPAQSLDDAYYFSAAAKLRDGRVLLTGGYTSSIQPTDQAWVYDPRGG